MTFVSVFQLSYQPQQDFLLQNFCTRVASGKLSTTYNPLGPLGSHPMFHISIASSAIFCRSSSVRSVFFPPLPILSYGCAILRRNYCRASVRITKNEMQQATDQILSMQCKGKETPQCKQGVHVWHVASKDVRTTEFVLWKFHVLATKESSNLFTCSLVSGKCH